MSSNRVITVLDTLDDLEECFEGFTAADLYILPPDDDGRLTDEDSADEDGGTVDNLNRNQLLAGAEVRILTSDDEDDVALARYVPVVPLRTANADSDLDPGPSTSTAPPAKRTRRIAPAAKISVPAVQLPQCSWKRGDRPSSASTPSQTWVTPTRTLDDNLGPAGLFELFMFRDIVEYICAETTAYATANDRVCCPQPDEMYAFFAILLSGYNPLPRRNMYWDTLGDIASPAVQGAFARADFLNLLSNLHCNDNSQLDRADKFSKMRPLIDKVNENCVANWQPEEIISIDESMIPYFGKHGAKQYMHGKPIKFGYKVWMATTRLGYAIGFIPYQGAGDHDKALGLGGTVVAKLLEPLVKRPYHVIFDNFFTSIPILQRLKLQGYEATGTLRANRCPGIPLPSVQECQKEETASYHVAYDSVSNLSAVRWKDNRPVTVLSTCKGAAPLSKTTRFCRVDKVRKSYDQPDCIHAYNHGMGGVDRFDQNIGAYQINIRMKKWWWPVFRYILDLCVSNAHQLYRLQQRDPKLAGTPMDLLRYRRELVHVYLRRFGCRQIPFPRAVSDDLRFDSQDHVPEKVDHSKRRKCAHCKKKSSFICQKCKVGLHVECWKTYHGSPSM